jgi:hypothetical protein
MISSKNIGKGKISSKSVMKQISSANKAGQGGDGESGLISSKSFSG